MRAYVCFVSVEELEEEHEGDWLHVWQFYFGVSSSHRPIEHGIEHCTADR